MGLRTGTRKRVAAAMDRYFQKRSKCSFRR
jgi:hypothetical protein